MKTQSFAFAITLAFTSWGAAKTCDEWVAQGRANLASSNLVSANVCFSNAVVQCPMNESANVFYAVTRLLVLPGQTPVSPFLTRLGLATTGRDLYHWTAEFATNSDGHWRVPTGVNAKEAPALLRNQELAQILGASANLAVVSNAAFRLALTTNDTALEAVAVDYGDILLLRAMLRAGEFLAYTAYAVNVDVLLTDAEAMLTNRTQGVQRLLATHPQLLTFATTKDLAAAKQAFVAAVDLYLKASDFIRARPWNVNHVFNYDPDMQAEELLFRETLRDLKSSLTSPVVWRVDSNYTFNAASVFKGLHAPREFLPAFTNNLIIEGTVPDPTFGGAVSGLSAAKVDKMLAGSFRMKSPDARWWMVSKSCNYIQSNDGAPAPNAVAPYSFSAMVALSAAGSVTNAYLRPPGGVSKPLQPASPWGTEDYGWITEFSTNSAFSAKAELDGVYPDGIYVTTICATNDGFRSVSLALRNDAYPSTPHIDNFTEAQALAVNQDFVLRWDPMIGGTTNDFVQVEVTVDLYGTPRVVFKTPDPWDVDTLDGTATSVTIPGTKLYAGMVGTVRLSFARVTDSDRKSFRAARGVAAYVKTTSCALQVTDLLNYSIAKGQIYTQTSGAAPVSSAVRPFEFRARMGGMGYSDTMTFALQTPGGSEESTNGWGPLELCSTFDSQQGLDTAYLNGNYSVSIDSPLMGMQTAGLTITNDAYPTTPRISNFADAQHIDNEQKFVLTWDAFAGGTTNDFIQIILNAGDPALIDPFGDNYALLSSPSYGSAKALNGTATSWVIPRRKLYAGHTYQGTLLFAKRSSVNTNGYPGALGFAAYYKMTTFQIHADQGQLPTDLAPIAMSWTGLPSVGAQLRVAVTVTNQGPRDIVGWGWWRYEFYLSPDGTVGASDSPFSTRDPSSPIFQSSTSITETFWLTLVSPPASDCFLVVRLTAMTPEGGTDYNTLALPITFSGPDLAATSFDWSGIAEPGGWIDVSWAVTNFGYQAVSNPVWWDSFYLSTDANGRNGVLLDDYYYYSYQLLGPGDGYAQAAQIRLPRVAPGDYYLALKTDAYGYVGDVCSTNNWLVRPITLGVPATAPDLVPVDLITNGPAIGGQELPITVVVANQGTDSAEPFWEYEIYLSSVPSWDRAARSLGQGWVSSSIQSGDILSLDWTVNLPADVYGSQYLIVRLDTRNGVYELSKTNNEFVLPVYVPPRPPVITQQPAGSLVNLGGWTTLYVGVDGTQPLHYQWRKDSVSIPGKTYQYLDLSDAQRSDAGQYDVIVSNAFGIATSQVATVTLNLMVADSLNPNPNAEVGALAIQPDGKLLVAGWFSILGGSYRAGLGRLNPDGTLDTSFHAGVYQVVNCLALQGDGKVLVGGDFSLLSGRNCNNLGRLNPDGTIDTSFDTGADNPVNCLALQPDGKILVGGWFTSLSGQGCYYLGRLNADGTRDTNFNGGAVDAVNTLALQPDGRIVIGGEFGLQRLNEDGSADDSFNAWADGPVTCLTLQANGKVLVGGQFDVLSDQTCSNLGRLNADGTFDADFTSGTDGQVHSLAVQVDGRILVGGQFTTLSGQWCRNLGRLNADGSVDPEVQPQADANDYESVMALGLQADGKVVVGGSFNGLGGQNRSGLGRLINSESASEHLSYHDSEMTWLRGGTAPEIRNVTFDYSRNGVLWTNLGAGQSTGGGWQIGSLNLPGTGKVRARGQISGGYQNGSAWFVESMRVLDTNQPSIAVLSPRPGQVGSNSVLIASGTAWDNVQVDSVWCQLNSNGWFQASGTTDWTVLLDLTTRTNVLQAYSVDTSGNMSSITNSTLVFSFSDRLQLTSAGKGTLSPNYSNALLEVGMPYTITATAGSGFSFVNWSGGVPSASGVLTNGRTLRFLMQPNLMLQANFLDTKPPTLTVKAPLPSKQYSNALFMVQGTAGDNMALQEVQMNLNNTGWQSAEGTTNWSKQVLLSTGTNTLLAYAVDSTGNRSTTNKVSFVYNQFIVLAGTYNGLFYPTNDLGATNCGAFTLTLANSLKGGFSGKLTLQGTNLAFSSALDSHLKAPLVNVPRGGKAPLALTLQLNPTWQDPATQRMLSNVVSGTLADGDLWGSDVLAFRAFAGKNNAYAGTYTMLIGGGDDATVSPPGDGGATVAVSGVGGVTVKGNLADRASLAGSTTLSSDGQWPLMLSLYGGRGLFMGWMMCDTNLRGVLGTNFWLKPAAVSKDPINTNGFLAWPPVLLSKYAPASAGRNSVNWTNGRVVLEFGNLLQPQTNYVVVSNNLVRVVSGTISNLKMGVTNKDGTFGGSFKHPGTNTLVKFSGVLVPADTGHDAYGGGWFLGPTEGGWVRFEREQ